MPAKMRMTTQERHLRNLFTRVKQTGMPVRIESGADIFYLLSAEQIAVLLRGRSSNSDLTDRFSAVDFGLTEVDLSDYETRRALRRELSPIPTPLDAELQQRLISFGESRADDLSTLQHNPERERILVEIEDAMFRNLTQAAAQAN